MKRIRRGLCLPLFVAGLWSASPASAKYDMMFNMRLGPAINAKDTVTQFALELEFGYKLLTHGRNNGYLVFPLAFQFGNNLTSIGIPLGFQYDFEMPGVKNFYLYPRFVIGYAVGFVSNADAQHKFVLAPAFGVKYVIKERFHFGFEPFNMPIAIGSEPFPGASGTTIHYRLMFYGGMSF